MDIPRAIIIAAGIIGGSIIVSQGVYSFSSERAGVANRYNKYTGSVSICAFHAFIGDCESFKKKAPDNFVKDSQTKDYSTPRPDPQPPK